MIFLSKDGQDEYINMFAKGCNSKPTSTENFTYESSTEPIVLRGILKHKIMKRCWQDNRTFYYMDTGYLGNQKNSLNPNGWKYWHRIVKNDLQHNKVIDCPADRWEALKLPIENWKKTGSKIIIAAPDEKPCKFYGIDKDQWIADTVLTLKKCTDREIIVRDRAKLRIHRIENDTLKQALDNDVFALVTYNSVAATESVLYGIPAFTLAPSNAAGPVACQDLSKIETPFYPSKDQVFEWACHLAYGQYHVNELKNGKALAMLKDLK